MPGSKKVKRTRRLGLLVAVIFVLLGAWWGLMRYKEEPSVNILTIAKQQRMIPSKDCPGGVCQAAPEGCYYQQVQCIQAPCNPILVCDTLKSSPIATASALPSPSPVSTPQSTCIANVRALTLKDKCGNNGFRTLTFRCNSDVEGRVDRVISFDGLDEACESAQVLYQKAVDKCGQTCKKSVPIIKTPTVPPPIN